MPIYEYQCDSCGLREEKFWARISTAQDSIPCSSCKVLMRKLVSAASFKFSHSEKQIRGAAPPNTGTSDDWDYDKAIGRDAEKKWGIIDKRAAEKDRVIRHEKENGLDLKRNQLVPTTEGGYRPIKEEERVRANAGREIAAEINQALSKKGKVSKTGSLDKP
jgi:putative FmdB family regulatory protein